MSQPQLPRPWFWLRGPDGAGRALAAVRHQAGLTQDQVARELKMDRDRVARAYDQAGPVAPAARRPGHRAAGGPGAAGG
ncbi:MAG TPA: helix-turn-helix transcriptional regulator [Trebonia sp.]|nr:helix-turn-helix transcriptional regulator [Trebonia sp.]